MFSAGGTLTVSHIKTLCQGGLQCAAFRKEFELFSPESHQLTDESETNSVDFGWFAVFKHGFSLSLIKAPTLSGILGQFCGNPVLEWDPNSQEWHSCPVSLQWAFPWCTGPALDLCPKTE